MAGTSLNFFLLVKEGKSTCRSRSYKDQSHIKIIQRVGVAKFEDNTSRNKKVMINVKVFSWQWQQQRAWEQDVIPVNSTV